MSFGEFFQAAGSIGDAYSAGAERFKQRNALAKLGTQLQGGDYNGAAQTAFAVGDVGTGVSLLKLGEERRQTKLQEDAGQWFQNGLSGGSGSLAALGADQSSGLSPLGAPSRSLPSFADTSGPAGGYLAGLETRESSGNPLARSRTSSATGLHQFTDKTWAGVMREHPELGLTANGRTDPEQSRRAVVAFTADNERVLQRAGLPVNDASRYASHFLGRSGGPRFVAGAVQNPDAPALTYANPDQVRANRTVFYNRDGSPKTAGQVMADFGRSFGGAQRPAGAPSRAGVAVANNEAETQALEARMGMVPPVRPPVAFASNEAETQALEARMGMTPQAPQQVASYDPRADMPAQGAIPMGFSIPEGQGAVGEEQPAGPQRSPLGASSIFNGDAARRANPSFGAPAMGAPPPGRTMSLPQDAGGPPAQVAQAGGPAPGAVSDGGASQTIGNVPVATIAGTGLGQRLPFLMRAVAHPNLPAGQRQLAQTLLKEALDEAKMPDSVKEFQYARANGWTQARTPAEYAREAKGPQTAAPGTAILTPDGRDIAFTVPDRNRSNVADDVAARREAALANGMQPGTPQFDNYVLGGKMLNEDQRPPSASDRKAINAAEDELPLIDSTLDTLTRAKELNKKTFTGLTANARGWLGTSLPDGLMPDLIADPKTAAATREFGQIMSMEAIKSMSQTLKGATTDREMSRFMEILGDPTTPPDIRGRTIDRMITLAQRQKAIATDRVNEMRAGTYYRPGGGQSTAAPSAPPADAVGYLRANPSLRGAFDAKYGAGAADRALGGR